MRGLFRQSSSYSLKVRSISAILFRRSAISSLIRALDQFGRTIPFPPHDMQSIFFRPWHFRQSVFPPVPLQVEHETCTSPPLHPSHLSFPVPLHLEQVPNFSPNIQLLLTKTRPVPEHGEQRIWLIPRQLSHVSCAVPLPAHEEHAQEQSKEPLPLHFSHDS